MGKNSPEGGEGGGGGDDCEEGGRMDCQPGGGPSSSSSTASLLPIICLSLSQFPRVSGFEFSKWHIEMPQHGVVLDSSPSSKNGILFFLA